MSLFNTHVLRKKSMQDYVFCMYSSLQFNPRYVLKLLFEDDALPNEDFFSLLDYMLHLHQLNDRYLTAYIIQTNQTW